VPLPIVLAAECLAAVFKCAAIRSRVTSHVFALSFVRTWCLKGIRIDLPKLAGATFEALANVATDFLLAL
jgi:hypothetical protein